MRLRTWNLAAAVTFAGACATASEQPSRKPSPAAPDAATQKAVFDLIKISTICLKFNQPNQSGEVVLKGVFSEPGSPAHVVDVRSTPGNERAVACTIEQAGRVRSPSPAGPREVIYSIPLPFDAEGIRIYFPPGEPANK
jgi:hypothetical protein